MTARARRPGEFCWVNMLTPNPTEARAFFSDLLGWTYDEMPHNMGHTIQVGGQNIGGLFDLAGPNCPPGTKPGFTAMIRVESADEVSKRIAELGGEVIRQPFDIMENGRMAVCRDPTGGLFDLWQPKNQSLAEVDGKQPGATGWFELLTADVSKARAFYEQLFGWTTEARPMYDFEYTICKLGDEEIAGIMPILSMMGEAKPAWSIYVTVESVEVAEKKAKELGGNVFLPVMQIEGVGRLCGIVSPQGVMLYVIEYSS